MSQSRLGSLTETVISTLIGMGASFAANLWMLPLWGYEVSARQAVEIGLLFTLVSVARGYFVRRLFNWIGGRA